MKYFFFDIDGTLSYWDRSGKYTEPVIPESTKVALRKLKEEGHFLAIATGRSFPMAKRFMDEFGLDNMVTDGGYGIVLNRELISCEPLDKENVVKLIDECDEKGYPWSIAPEITKTRYMPDDSFYNTTHCHYMENEIIEGLDIRKYDRIYKAFIACKEPLEQKLENLKNVPWCRYHDTYIFIEPCMKSIGIKKIVDHFGGDYKDVVVFGDEKNDITMFQDDWTKIAMGNGCQEVKDLATYVTSDVTDNGIYNACVHFGWIKE